MSVSSLYYPVPPPSREDIQEELDGDDADSLPLEQCYLVCPYLKENFSNPLFECEDNTELIEQLYFTLPTESSKRAYYLALASRKAMEKGVCRTCMKTTAQCTCPLSVCIETSYLHVQTSSSVLYYLLTE